MSRSTITAIWAAGIVLTLIVYLAGPDRFVVAALDIVQRGWWAVQDMLHNISIAAFDLVRAAAIGLFFVFAALTVLAIRQGLGGVGTLIAVSLVFLGLVWQSGGDGFGAHTRWMAALLLTAVGALTMTRRLNLPASSPWRPGSVPPHHGP